MLLVAEVGDLQGDEAVARRGFLEAARSTSELLQREPNNWQRIYDHAQSEFWLAYAAHSRGDNPGALPHFTAYRDLSRRLVRIEPAKLESKLELASSEVNLGVALVAERRFERALGSFNTAAKTLDGIRPQTRDVSLVLNQALGHKATTLFVLGDNNGALASRQEQLALLSRPPLNPTDREVQESRAIVLAQTGVALLAEGHVRAADRTLGQATSAWNELVALDPANDMWAGERNAARMWRAVASAGSSPAAAREELGAVIADQRLLIGKNEEWAHKINLLRMIAFDRVLGGRNTAGKEPVIAQAWSRRDTLKADERAVLAAVLISEGDRAKAHDPREAEKLWREAQALVPTYQTGTWAVVQRARLARRFGREAPSAGSVQPTAFAGLFMRSPRQ